MQPPIHAENRAGNDVQQPINNEDVSVPPDVDPLPDNVDHWVRRSTRRRRQSIRQGRVLSDMPKKRALISKRFSLQWLR